MKWFTPFAARRLRRAARQYFGWTTLRSGQLDAMRALYRGKDALVILPTGGGKSAVYQVPATLLGPTLVISPLLALQADQIAGLNERGDPMLRAVRISSAETPRQQEHALAEIRAGRARFLFITPEQLAKPERLAEVKALKPALVAVDEAHCISAWGHEFRPDYLALGHYIRDLGRPPIVALTATASPPVRDDIIARLGLKNPTTVISGLDRPNISLAVDYCSTDAARWRSLVTFLKTQGSDRQGIIYVPTRRAAEELAAKLTGAGFPAEFYHGGLGSGAREERHEEFLADSAPIMVATSAFGMGIDKPDIRYVVHMALPDSPDSYQQEIGRAGRDGQPAQALLLWRAEDEALQRYFTGGPPDFSELCQLAVVLREGPTSKTALAKKTGLGVRKLPQLLALLEEVGAAATLANNRIVVPTHAPQPSVAAKAAVAEAERRQALQLTRVEMMRGFAQGTGCRGRKLLAYFGEHAPGDCGHCDNCTAVPRAGAPAPAPAQRGGEPFAVHSSVRHGDWGIGMVLAYEQDKMTVLFDEVGYKTLSVPVVVGQKLLVPA
ncbi:RecQ family ATP-dependent DNA helicase [Allocatelliglobosispora scoriae]|nr:RecQ family ATP-dependent DNA helicase [Allocatelliglobosispora scoriae]